jgi:multiple sugar transport system substrate-binding protein
MSTHKKSLFVLTVVIIALSLVANVAIFRTPAATAQGSGEIRISSWDSGFALEPFNSAIKVFEEQYPDIDVNLESVPQDYGPKLLAQIAAGTAPDVIQVGDGSVAQYVRDGILEPLDPFITGDNPLDVSVFYPGPLEFGQVGGTTYLLPKDYSPLVLYYNKDIFDEAGLEYPNENWTWDDLLSAAQALTTDDRWGIQIPDSWGDWLWDRGIQPLIVQNGGSLVSDDGLTVEGYMNSEATVGALQWYVDLFKVHKVAPTNEDVAAYAGVDLFTNGIVAMQWTGRWPLSTYKDTEGFNFGTMGLPAGPAGKGNVLCWAGFAINAESNNKDAAWTWLKFIAAEEGAEEFAAYALTAVQPIAESQGLTEDPYDAPIMADLFNVYVIPDALTPYYGECVLQPFRDNMEKVFLEDKPLQEALDEAAATGQACLDEKNAM